MRESRRVRSLVEDNGQAGDSKICSRRWQSAHFSSIIGVSADCRRRLRFLESTLPESRFGSIRRCAYCQRSVKCKQMSLWNANRKPFRSDRKAAVPCRICFLKSLTGACWREGRLPNDKRS